MWRKRSLAWIIFTVSRLCWLASVGLADDAGLVGYWTFDDPAATEKLPRFRSSLVAVDSRTILIRSTRSGEVATAPRIEEVADHSGQGNRGRVRGPIAVASIRGTALEFDGCRGFVEVADSASLRISGPVTIQMWICPQDFQHSGIISKDFARGGPSWCQMYFWSGDPHLQVAVNNDDGPTVKSRTAFELGRWYHVAMSYDGKSRTRVYVDGVLEREDGTTFTGPIPVGKETLKIGRRPDGLFFRGAIDDVRIAARELAPEAIKTSYETTKPEHGPPCRKTPPPASEPIPLEVGISALRNTGVLSEDQHVRNVEVTWEQIDRQLPASAENLARNAEFSGFALTFPKPMEMDTVILHTSGEHVYGRNKEGIRDYHLECHTAGGNWTTLAGVKGNRRECIIHRFEPVVTDEVRVDVTAANRYEEISLWDGCYGSGKPAAPAKLRGIEVYRLGEEKAFHVKRVSRMVKVEKSSLGGIAIFKDDVPMPEGVASSPDYLAERLRRAGYGVTFLDAELLSNSGLLSKEHFDLFIHPYGCSFPLGTTLYQFLEAGGHLLTVGGQAFSNALERTADGRLLSTGCDPGIIATPATMRQLDWYVPLREQLGLFAGPFQVFEEVASARATASQRVVAPSLFLERSLEGYPSTGLVGQVIPIEEEKRYVGEGKEAAYVLKARQGIQEAGKVRSILHADHNYLVFNKPCARWLPLLESYDRFDRPRGSAGAMILNHDGLYAGSIWAFFGATNRDLFPPGDEAMATAFLDIVNFQARATFLHGLRPRYSCYRQGERARVQVFAANFGKRERTGRVTFQFLPQQGAIPVFSQVRAVRLTQGHATLVEAEWAPKRFDLDCYRVLCVLEIDGAPIDEMETGFVVWNDQAMQRDSAFRVSFHDNYFHDGDRPVFIVGTRSDGLSRPGQHGEDPLAWDRCYQAMQDFGMNVVSPVFLQIYLPYFLLDSPPEDLIPEEMLRQLDAQVQLCQRHKLIYAPCLFFEHQDECLKREKIEWAARLAKFLGDRYCRAPGIIFYLWDDGVYFGKTSREGFLELTRRCIDQLATNPAGRRYVTTAEIMGSQHIGTRRAQEHLTFGHHWYRSCSQKVLARMSDLRAAGQSQACGEFYFSAARPGDDAAHRFYLDYPHNEFALGYSWILNWKWGDNDSVIFPWGIVFPCDRIPKPPLYTYRNLSWFFRSIRPKYVQPELMFVLPNAYWDKNQTTDSGNDFREIDNDLLVLLDKVMALGHVNLGVVDDFDLPGLGPQTKALIYPWAMCPDDKTYRWLLDFLRGGGHLYVSGDVSYDSSGRGRHPNRLEELAGVGLVAQQHDPRVPVSLRAAGRPTTIKPVAPLAGWADAYQGRVDLQLRPAGARVLAVDVEGRPVVVSHTVGKGLALFNADLGVDVPAGLIKAFLQEAGVERVRTDPDDPAQISVFRVPTQDGEIFGLTSEKTHPSITISTAPSPVTLRKTRSPMVMAGFDKQGRLTSCESDGLVQLSGRTIIDSSASVMIFTLDGKPIEQSEAVILLPQPCVPSECRLQLAAAIDLLEIGDISQGIWKTHRQLPVAPGSQGVRLSLDKTESLGVVLLTRRQRRDEQVERLRAFLQGYLN